MSKAIKSRINLFWKFPKAFFDECSGDGGWNKDNVGSYGVYKNYGNIGIKVIYSPDGDMRIPRRKTKEELKNSKEWKKAKAEFDLLWKLRSSGRTPVPYGVRPIKVGEHWFPAIFMQHIEGEHYYPDTWDWDEEDWRKSYVGKLLHKLNQQFGISLEDHGSRNIIKSKRGKYYFIDMGPDYVKEKRQ